MAGKSVVSEMEKARWQAGHIRVGHNSTLTQECVQMQALDSLLAQTEHSDDSDDGVYAMVEILLAPLLSLWTEQTRMQLSSAGPDGFILNGECPHCRRLAAFPAMTKPYTEDHPDPLGHRMIAACRCIACNGYILGIVRTELVTRSSARWIYDAHYPIGLPSDSVEDDVPVKIREDFSEALRCYGAKAYNATAEMCRRAIHTSCDDLKAAGNGLTQQIEDLVKQGKITAPLKAMADKIRLGGNRGAHDPNPITDQEAEALVSFTRHYVEHVYIMPAKMGKHDFSKSGRKP